MIALLSVLTHVDAASLVGNRFEFSLSGRRLASYYFGAGTPAEATSNSLFTNGSDDLSLLPLDPLKPATGRFGRFTRVDVDGIALPDLLSGNVTTVAVGKSSNAVKLTSSDLLFNSNSFVLDMADMGRDLDNPAVPFGKPGSVTADDQPSRVDHVKSRASSIPLPPAFPLLAAAILALAGFGYGLNRWVAPQGARKAP